MHGRNLKNTDHLDPLTGYPIGIMLGQNVNLGQGVSVVLCIESGLQVESFSKLEMTE